MKPDQGATKATAALERSLGAEGSVDLDPQTGAVDFVRRTDGYLTGPSTSPAADVVTEYVRGRAAAFGLAASDLTTLGPVKQYTSIDGVTHVTVPQVVGGIESYDTMLMGNVDAKGRLINITAAPASDLAPNTLSPTLDADAALQAARVDVGADTTVPAVTTRGGGADRSVRYATETESARLVVFVQPGQDRLAWDVNVLDSHSLLYRVAVDAESGTTLARTSLTAFDSNDANAWANYPSKPPAVPMSVNFGTDPSWLDRSAANGNQLIGNNAHAYHDDNGVNGYQSGDEVVRNGGVNWIYPMTFYNQAGCPAAGCTWDSATPATKTVNRNAGTVSLFYLVNHFHDHLLAPPIGFDEASRNFEQVNASGQGVGNDAVLAEAQDSSGINNANFSTPPDGSPGRMQMYLWDGTPGTVGPQYDVDGSASAEIVYHEYAHGLSNRLVGNGSGLGAIQSGAMGEAWSDFYALDLLVAEGAIPDTAATGEVWMGEYATGVPGIFGGTSRIRHQAIDCTVGASAAVCPASGTADSGGYTYGDLGKIGVTNGVHDSGEVWSQTLWDLRKAVGRTNALKIITGGMRLSPNQPSMLTMRDSILQAAQVNGVNTATVWAVFAARGFGYFATTPSATTNSATEDFSLPPDLLHVSTVIDDNAPRGDGDGLAEPGETIFVRTSVQNTTASPISGITGSVTAPGALVNRGTATWPTIAPGNTAVSDLPFAVTVPETFPCGDSLALTVAVNGPGGPVPAIPVITVPVLGVPTFVSSADVPKAIPDNSPSGVASTLNLLGNATVSDLDIKIDQLTHTWVGDLKITLTHGATTVVLADRPGAGTNGSSGDNFVNLVFDDEAAAPIEGIGNTPNGFTGSYRPNESLSAFDGQPVSGTWTLTVSDNASGDAGTLQAWSLSPAAPCPASFGVPAATTGAAQETTASQSRLAGTLDAKGRATDYRFEWGTTASYGQLSPVTAGGSSNGPVPVTWTQPGLTPSTEYHYRLLALRDGVVLAAGADQTVRTGDLPPVAVTGTVAAVGQTSATLSGSVDANSVATSYRFEYGPTTAYGSSTPVASAGAGPDPVDVTADVAGLTASTDYHVRLLALRGDVVVATGADVSFRTADVPVSPRPPSAPRGVKARPANRAAVVSWLAPASTGTSPITGYRVTASPGRRTCTTTGARTCTVTGLTNRVTYRFTVRAVSLAGTGPASAPSLPVIAGAPTSPARVVVTSPAPRLARVSWTVPASRGSGPILRYQLRWSANSGRTWSAWANTGLLRTAIRPGLVKGRSYRVEVRAVNASGAGPATAVAFRQTR